MRLRHILYIDDEPDQLEMIQSLLERALPSVMVEVCCTAHGAEGFLNSRCYDLVISDVAIPGELGTDIAAKILERDPQQPIYLMSEYTGEKVKEDAERIGLELHPKISQRGADEFIADIKRMIDQRPCDSTSLSSPGPNGEVADSPATSADTPAARTNNNTIARIGSSTEEISRRPKQIRLTSQHVLAARAAIGKVA